MHKCDADPRLWENDSFEVAIGYSWKYVQFIGKQGTLFYCWAPNCECFEFSGKKKGGGGGLINISERFKLLSGKNLLNWKKKKLCGGKKL